MEDGGREWCEVRRKSSRVIGTGKLRRTDWFNPSQKNRKNGIAHKKEPISYFFTECLANYGAKEMFGVFNKYGHVDEVVIPARKDKYGRRYGFARFHDVRDPEFFAIQLDNILIGNQKLHVNLPRFHRVRDAGHNVATKRGSGKIGALENKNCGVQKEWRQVSKGVTYANAVKRKVEPRNNTHAGRKADTGMGRFAHLEFSVGAETLEKMQQAFVGTVTNPGATYTLQEEFHRQGVFGVKATPLGANLVLLEAEDPAELTELVKEENGWLSQWFEEVRVWSPRDVDNERFAWLRCYGIPAHAWSVDFFERLILPIGKYVGTDDSTRLRKKLDVARILYRTKVHDLVNRVVRVKINEEVFSIKMVEDWYGNLSWNGGTKAQASECRSVDDSGDDGSRFSEAVEDEEGSVGSEPSLGGALNEIINDDMGGVDCNGVNVELGDGGIMLNVECGEDEHDNCCQKLLQIVEDTYSQNWLSNARDSVEVVPETVNAENNVVGHFLDTVHVGLATSSIGPHCGVRSNGGSGGKFGPNVQHVNSLEIADGVGPIFAVGGDSSGRSIQKALGVPIEVSGNQLRIDRRGENSIGVQSNASVSFSGGAVFCDGSVVSSDVRRCNARFWARKDTEVAGKVWLQATDIGLVGHELEDVSVGRVRKMEARDKAEKVQREFNNSVL